MQHDDDRDRDDERHRVQEGIGHAEQIERLLEQVRHRRLTDPAKQDRADRDAELRTCQHHRQVLARADHRDRAALASFGEGFEAVAARRDQRELRTHEECVRREQQHGQQHRENVAAHQRSPSPSSESESPRRPCLVSSSRSIRLPSIRTTVASQRTGSSIGPSVSNAVNSTASPGLGMWPSSCITSPPMVSYSPSGARKPAFSATSSMRSRPETRQLSRLIRSTSGVTSSCSSRTSPTISSIRSSIVTMPAVPPYSSATSTVCNLLARTCAITSSPSSVEGTTGTAVARPESPVRDRSSGATSKTCLTCTSPIVSSRSPSTIGKRE